jgi:hypothetical protein
LQPPTITHYLWWDFLLVGSGVRKVLTPNLCAVSFSRIGRRLSVDRVESRKNGHQDAPIKIDTRPLGTDLKIQTQLTNEWIIMNSRYKEWQSISPYFVLVIPVLRKKSLAGAPGLCDTLFPQIAEW